MLWYAPGAVRGSWGILAGWIGVGTGLSLRPSWIVRQEPLEQKGVKNSAQTELGEHAEGDRPHPPHPG